MSLIKLDDISKSFILGSQQLFALHHLSLQVHRGDMLAISGPSGSGKTTLMNVIGLLDRPDQGQYYLNGQDLSHAHDKQLSSIRNRSIGFVFQQFHLLPKFSVLYNVALPLFYRNMNEKEAFEQALDSLNHVGMSAFSERYPHQLSGGQQQRIAIARALVGDPDVILADEPTGALDSTTSQEIMRLLLRLNAQGRTILIVTHDTHIAGLCGKNLSMRDGNIQAQSWV